MMRNTQYNCKLGKGCGLIEETLSLLEIYQDGMTIDALLEYVHQSNTDMSFTYCFKHFIYEDVHFLQM